MERREKILNEILNSWKGKTHSVYPTEIDGKMTLDEAYIIQDILTQRLVPSFGEVSGYKVAFHDKAAFEKFGIKEPVSGRLFSSQLVKNGGIIDSSEYSVFHIEAEIAFKIGKRIDKIIEDTRLLIEAVSSVHLALDIADNRYDATKREQNIRDFVSGGAGAHNYVIGEGTAINETKEFAIRMTRNEELIYEGNTLSMEGGAWGNLKWMVNNVVKRGFVVEPGDIMLSGKVSPPYKGEPKGLYVGYCDILGQISCVVQ